MNNFKSKVPEVLELRIFSKLSVCATVLAGLSSSQSGRNMQPITNFCLFLRLTVRGAYLQLPTHLHDMMYNRTQVQLERG